MKLRLFVLCAGLAAGQDVKFRTAQVAFAAAATADILSSRGMHETNPLLGRGDFGARQIAISAGISFAAGYAAHKLQRSHPKLTKPLTIALFAMAGARGAVAFRNSRIK